MIQTRNYIDKPDRESSSLQDSKKPQVDKTRKCLAYVEQGQAGLVRTNRQNSTSNIYLNHVLGSLAFQDEALLVSMHLLRNSPLI